MMRKKLNRGSKIALVILILLNCVACNYEEAYKSEVALEEFKTKDYDNDGKEINGLNFNYQNNKAYGNQDKSNYESNDLDLKIIKTADVKYKVASINSAATQLKEITKKAGGYISEMSYNDNVYRKENRFVVKVPRAQFDVLLDSMNTMAEFIDYAKVATQDVTEEYVDVQTRLKTKLEVKARYEEILRKRAKTVEDILNAEEKLQQIQEEIEASQGRLRYLSNRVTFSTINVELYETVEHKEAPVSYTRSFGSKLTSALKSGWKAIELFLLTLVHIWPIVILFTGIFIWYRRKRKKKQA